MKISDTTIRRDHKKCWHLTKMLTVYNYGENLRQRELLMKSALRKQSACFHWGRDGPIISLLTSLFETAKNPLLMLSCGLWTPSEGRELHDNSESEAEVCITMETVKPLKCCRLSTMKKVLWAEIHPMQSLHEESVLLTIWWLFLLPHFIKQFVHSTIFCLWSLVREPKSSFEAFTAG